jgi:hypothetical protein
LRKATEAHSNKLETHEKNLSLINNEVSKIVGIESTLGQHVIKTKLKIHKLKKFVSTNSKSEFRSGQFNEIKISGNRS